MLQLETTKLTDPTARAATTPVIGKQRVQSIDLLRGLVIVLMVLDHTRDFFMSQSIDPTDLANTTPVLFLTRWITHYCAPTFVFLAGLSAQRMSKRRSGGALSRFLLVRGLWLVALEFSVVNFMWMFNLRYQLGLVMQVIWAIGVSLVVLAALAPLPRWAIGALGAALVLGHNLLDPLAPSSFGAWAELWNVVHVRGPTSFGLVVYPVVPWIGVMALGYWAGPLYDLTPVQRRSWLLSLGAAACVGFALVRLLNGYGDPSPWSTQPSPVYTLLSILNVSKYPPSLAYVLMTLGPALLLLAAFETLEGRVPAMFVTIGRVPLLAYVLHLGLVHLLAGLTGLATGHGSSMLTDIFLFYPKDWGFGLGIVYVAWFSVLAVLYPACFWFAGVKQRRDEWWLSFL